MSHEQARLNMPNIFIKSKLKRISLLNKLRIFKNKLRYSDTCRDDQIKIPIAVISILTDYNRNVTSCLTILGK